MNIKRFNQLNSQIFESITQEEIKTFYKEFKKIVNYDVDEFEQGDEPTELDLLDEIGDLANKYNLDEYDLKEILETYQNDNDIQYYINIITEDTIKNSNKDKNMSDIIKNLLKEMYERLHYLKHEKRNDETNGRIKELTNCIVRVQQIGLKQFED